jgi:serine/threonine protein kinase
VGTQAQKRVLPEMGAVLAGKYRIVGQLGQGGMGVVYEAVHTRIEQRVAIKMLLPEVLDVPDVVSRFDREARAAGKLKSENTARVLDVDISESGLPYMVMEFLDGSDLGKILEQGGALPVALAVDFVLQASNAMIEAHAAGVIHRDLKPSNLFVTANRKLKVLDFGISKLENDKEARVTATKAVVGTPLYMSPEQVRSAKHVDARTDIWSLGIILYELLTGRTPFEGSTTAAAAAICIDAPPPIATFRQDVPPALEDAILVALQKEPSRRYPTVQALAIAIAPFGSGSVQAPEPAPSTRAPVQYTTSSPDLMRMESARTLPHSDPSIPMTSERGAPVGTLPGWTTRSSPRKRRARWVIALVVGALASFALAVGVVSQRRPGADTPSVSRVDTARPAPASASVPIAETVPSATVMETLPTTKPAAAATAHATVRLHPTASSSAPTVTATATHTAAPLPTRL